VVDLSLELSNLSLQSQFLHLTVFFLLLGSFEGLMLLGKLLLLLHKLLLPHFSKLVELPLEQALQSRPLLGNGKTLDLLLSFLHLELLCGDLLLEELVLLLQKLLLDTNSLLE